MKKSKLFTLALAASLFAASAVANINDDCNQAVNDYLYVSAYTAAKTESMSPSSIDKMLVIDNELVQINTEIDAMRNRGDSEQLITSELSKFYRELNKMALLTQEGVGI